MTTPESFREATVPSCVEPSVHAGKSGPGPDSDRDDREISPATKPLGPGKFWTRDVADHSRWLTLGFTLVELMMVIAIIGSLTAIGYPQYKKGVTEAEESKAVSDMVIIEQEILLYYVQHGQYPNSLADIGKDTMLDPWGRPYKYLDITTASGVGKLRKDHNQVPINSDFDLYSVGPDGKSSSPLTSQNSYDDIVRGSNGAYFGPAHEY